jgi:hypothetical protein
VQQCGVQGGSCSPLLALVRLQLRVRLRLCIDMRHTRAPSLPPPAAEFNDTIKYTMFHVCR